MPKNRSFAPPPSRGPQGSRFEHPAAHHPPPRTVNVFNNVTIVNEVDRIARMECVQGRYAWHRHGGLDVCHYYDYSGSHWFGWHIGLDFYWTRRHAGFWWWYDRGRDRWCYWHEGYWWWPAGRPGVVYVVINNEYYPPEEAPVEVPVAEAVAQVEDALSPAPGEDLYFRNQQRDRMVRIYGPDREAFLYDASEKQRFRPVFLASGVTDVRMSDDSGGKPLQILVEKMDGSFEIFDAQGNPYLPARPKDG